MLMSIITYAENRTANQISDYINTVRILHKIEKESNTIKFHSKRWN